MIKANDFLLFGMALSLFGIPVAMAQAGNPAGYCVTRFENPYYGSVLGTVIVTVGCEGEETRTFKKWGCYTVSCEEKFVREEVASELRKAGIHYVTTIVAKPFGLASTVFKKGYVERDQADGLGLMVREIRQDRRTNKVSETLYSLLDGDEVSFPKEERACISDYSRVSRIAGMYDYKLTGVVPMPSYYGPDEYLILIKNSE